MMRYQNWWSIVHYKVKKCLRRVIFDNMKIKITRMVHLHVLQGICLDKYLSRHPKIHKIHYDRFPPTILLPKPMEKIYALMASLHSKDVKL